MKTCFKCGTAWEGIGQPGIKAHCEHCGEDLHVCANCVNFNEQKPHHCAVDTDPVRDKQRANYCEEFCFSENRDRRTTSRSTDDAQKARDAWNKLFKKP
jgi:hypothetical protein